jgi:hypothetical protein
MRFGNEEEGVCVMSKHSQQPKRWFALLWDDEFNAQHIGKKLVLKTPIECRVYSPEGEQPIPYGYPVKSEGSREVGGVEKKRLVPLAFDAILAPSGEVVVVGKPPFSSIEKWLEMMGFPNELGIVVEIIERPGTASSLRVYRNETASRAIPF